MKGADLEFFKRVWATDLSVFENRLRAIKFHNGKRFFDAGCGVGQWSVVASFINEEVYSIDIDPRRVDVLSKIQLELDIQNLHVLSGTIESTGFTDNYFDLIFCYSSIYFTDFRKSIIEFHRILKPSGRLYICSNGLGWYLHNLIDGHNNSQNFDARSMAIETIANSINFYAISIYKSVGQLIIPSEVLKQHLEACGFTKIITGAEGTIRLEQGVTIKPFYKEQYYQKEGVYEILAWKKN